VGREAARLLEDPAGDSEEAQKKWREQYEALGRSATSSRARR
jgi:hypothetical protein